MAEPTRIRVSFTSEDPGNEGTVLDSAVFEIDKQAAIHQDISMLIADMYEADMGLGNWCQGAIDF